MFLFTGDLGDWTCRSYIVCFMYTNSRPPRIPSPQYAFTWFWTLFPQTYSNKLYNIYSYICLQSFPWNRFIYVNDLFSLLIRGRTNGTYKYEAELDVRVWSSSEGKENLTRANFLHLNIQSTIINIMGLCGIIIDY